MAVKNRSGTRLREKGGTKTEFKAILDELKSLDGKIEVGFVAGLSDPENVKKSFFAEFGTPNALQPDPPRPHIREAFDKQARAKAIAGVQLPRPRGDARTRKYKQEMADLRKKYLAQIAFELANAIRDEIMLKDTPRNAPATVEKKGFNDPLIETGEMMNDVSWRVRDKKGKFVAQGFWNDDPGARDTE